MTDHNANKIPILVYHRVISNWHKLRYARSWDNFISEYHFTQQMRYIAQNGYRTIGCDEFYDWYTSKEEFPKKTVMLTFDDAFYEIYHIAYPVLRELNLSATIFSVGKNIAPSTSARLYNLSKHFIGQDVMDKVAVEYPNIEFQFHTFDLHRKINNIPVIEHMTNREIQEDLNKAQKWGFSYIAHPYGHYTQEYANALADSTFKLGFGYGNDQYATRQDNKYNISRIKISGNISMRKFKQIIKQNPSSLNGGAKK